MRFFPPAVAMCLVLAMIPAGRRAAAATPPARAPAAQRPAPAPPPADNDAPARHLKRTACLKEARSKKLVGAQRTAYIKACVGPA